MLLSRFFAFLRERFGTPTVVVVPWEERRAVPVHAHVPAQARAPLTAVEILRGEPHITATELVARTGVTLSYANSLVRRKKPRRPPAPVVPARKAVAPIPSAEPRYTAQILEAAAAGTNLNEIAGKFNIAPGEVEFVIKVARIQKESKISRDSFDIAIR